MQHHRKHSRQVCSLAADWVSPLRKARGHIGNISNGGAYMNTTADAAVGESITIYIARPETLWCLRTRAIVTRNDPEGLGLCWKAPRGGAILSKLLETEGFAPFQEAGLLGDRNQHFTAEVRIEQALSHQRRFWEQLLDTIPVPVFHKDADGCYRGCNDAFAGQILGLPKERIVGCSLYDLPDCIPHQLAAVYHRQDQALIEQQGTQTYEAQVRCADGHIRDFLFTKAVYCQADGKVAGLVGVMLDITARKQTEAALIESEARYRRLFEDAVLGIFQSTLDGRLLSVNPSMARIFGYKSPADLMRSVDDVASDLYETPAERQKMIAHLIRSPMPVTREIRYRRRDSSIFVGNLHAWKVKDDNDHILYIEGFVEDISVRKEIEESLKESESRLRYLSSQLLAAQENERRRISLEIHDDMGQNLAVLKLKLQSMSAKLRKDQPKLKRECRRVLGDIDKIIAKARHLAHDLSPSIIDDLKLCGTLRSMAADFRRLAGIRIELSMDDIDDLFDREAQIVLYRICQEALNNIVRHARAETVRITVRYRDGDVRFHIEDDGGGFNPQVVWRGSPNRCGMGLAAMAERARMLGGSLAIDSAGARGTRIMLVVPVTGKESSRETLSNRPGRRSCDPARWNSQADR